MSESSDEQLIPEYDRDRYKSHRDQYERMKKLQRDKQLIPRKSRGPYEPQRNQIKRLDKLQDKQ